MEKSHIKITVRGFHIDVFGHVNNARYLEFLEEARWEIFSNALSVLPTRGLSFAVVNVNINYRRPALLGQFLLIDAELTRFGNSSFSIEQKVVDANAPEIIFADAVVTGVLINEKGKSESLTDEIRQILFAGA